MDGRRDGARWGRAVWFALGLALTGCGGGGGGGGGGTLGAAGPRVSGKVVAGTVVGAIVRVFQVNPDRTLTLLAEGTTAADGTYTLTPSGDGPFLVLAGGGTYRDEATGQTRTLAPPPIPATLDAPRPGTLESIVGSGAGTGPVPVSLTPLSTFAARRTAALSASDPSALTEAGVTAAARTVGEEMGLGPGVDPRSVVPLDFGDPANAAAIAADPNGPAARMGAVLAGLSQAAKDLGLADPLQFVDALASDFSDGVFNGQAGGTSIPLGSGTLSGQAATGDLASSMNAFLDDPTVNQSGTTSTSFTTLTQSVATQDVAPPGVNKAPTIDPIANQATNAGAAPQVVTLTGLGPGTGEGQTITLSASSSAPGVVPDPTIALAGGTGTLTYLPLSAGTATITVTVRDDGGTMNGGVDTATRTFQVTVGPALTSPPTITNAPPTTAVATFGYTHTVTLTGNPAPVVSATGLPAWLTLSGATLSGTPAPGDVGQVSSITILASNSVGSASQGLSLAVVAPVAPTITSVAPTTAQVGVAYTYTLTATGVPAPSFSASGLPAWLTLNGTVLSGTPGAGDQGTTGLITVTASNGVAPAASQAFTIDVTGPPGIVSAPVTVAVVGQAYTYSVTLAGNPAPTLSATGLPAWLSQVGNTVTGTPGPGDQGATGTITLTASNGINPDAVQQYTIDVQGPPAITSLAPVATATVGVPYTHTFTTTGNPAPTLSLSGAPAWLSLSGSALSGTPGPGDVGSVTTVTVTADNGVAPAASQVWAITVTGPPQITSTPVTVATVGQVYTYAFTAIGSPAPVTTATGLPAWLSQVGNTVTGTPGPGDQGATGTITLTASNGINPDAVQQYTIDVQGPPAITSLAPVATATVGAPYTHTFTTTGNPAPTLSLSGAPAWLSLSGSALSGTPGPGDVGSVTTVTVTADNGVAPAASQVWAITVTGPPQITSTPVTVATVGTPYVYTIVVTGHPTPVLQVTGLPAWLTLAGNTLSGTPQVGDLGTTGTITVRALDNGIGPDATQPFQITVSPTHPTGTWDSSTWDGASWGN